MEKWWHESEVNEIERWQRKSIDRKRQIHRDFREMGHICCSMSYRSLCHHGYFCQSPSSLHAHTHSLDGPPELSTPVYTRSLKRVVKGL